MGYTDPMLPFEGIHNTAEDRKRVQKFRRKNRLPCNRPGCNRDAKVSFRMDDGELVDVCLTCFVWLGMEAREIDCDEGSDGHSVDVAGEMAS